MDQITIPTKTDTTESDATNITGSDINNMKNKINELVSFINALVIDGIIPESYLPSLYLSNTSFGGDNTQENPIKVISVEE